MNCNHCNQEAEWVENKEVYGKNYGQSYMIWLCRPCDAYVGCHNNTKTPKGNFLAKAKRSLPKESCTTFLVSATNNKISPGLPPRRSMILFS